MCYISNYSWLDGRSHTGLRSRLLAEFDQVWVDSLNGDKFKNGKQTPYGESDPSVFSTPGNREGIQVGTAVVTLVRTPSHTNPAEVRFRDFWGEEKRAELLASAEPFQPEKYERVQPIQALGLTFRPMKTDAAYTGWPPLPDVVPEYFAGVQTKRDELVVDIDRSSLEQRMRRYFDPAISHAQMKSECECAMRDTNRFSAEATRNQLRLRGIRLEHLVPFAYRPFDLRWLYWEPETRLLGEKSPRFFPNVFPGNQWIVAQQISRKEWNAPQLVTRLGCLDLMDRSASFFPLFLRPTATDTLPFGDDPHAHRRLGANLVNISDAALHYLAALGGGVADAPALLHHIIAVLHAPMYATDNGDALRQDWPRVPLPADRTALLASAELGKRVAALLDPEATVTGVTTKLPDGMKMIGDPTKAGVKQLAETDFGVTARWGIVGNGGVTMPSTGKVDERAFRPEEVAALGEEGVSLLGPDTVDVYMNADTHWRNVPRRVWEYKLGGYQVLKKWLSYREKGSGAKTILGRNLTFEEVKHVRDTARRIAALLLLGPKLDANYQATAANPHPWTTDLPAPADGEVQTELPAD